LIIIQINQVGFINPPYFSPHRLLEERVQQTQVQRDSQDQRQTQQHQKGIWVLVMFFKECQTSPKMSRGGVIIPF
jgi:hypothetical protein